MEENGFKQEVSEFKGSTSAKLEMIFCQLEEIKKEVKDLSNFKSKMVGMATLAGFAAGFLKDWIFRK